MCWPGQWTSKVEHGERVLTHNFSIEYKTRVSEIAFESEDLWGKGIFEEKGSRQCKQYKIQNFNTFVHKYMNKEYPNVDELGHFN